MHAVTPNEVAIAVKMATMSWIIYFQVSFFMLFNIKFFIFNLSFHSGLVGAELRFRP